MSAIHIVVPYGDIPAEARALLDTLFTNEGAEIWWNSRNRLLGGERPHEVELARAVALLDALADGAYF